MRRVILGLALVLLSACGAKRFGRIVTTVEASPEDPALLLVTSCDLLYKKGDIDATSVGNCRRSGVRRSAAPPGTTTPPETAEGRIVTGIFEHEGGGTTITTCRIVYKGGRHNLADCRDAVVSTAPAGAR